MVHKLTGALTLGAALLLSTSAFAQDKRVVTWNADYDPIPLAAAALALLALIVTLITFNQRGNDAELATAGN